MNNTNLVNYPLDSILDGLKTSNEKVVRYIYKKYLPFIKALVLKNSGNTEDAEDIFQDAMIILLNKAKINELTITCSFGTFLYSICWHLWLQILNNKKQKYMVMKVKNKNNFEVAPDESSFMINDKNELYNIVNNQFIRLDNKSQQLLSLYMDGICYKETARIMGYSSENYVKARKYLCKEKLKSLVLDDPKYKRLMLESDVVSLLGA